MTHIYAPEIGNFQEAFLDRRIELPEVEHPLVSRPWPILACSLFTPSQSLLTQSRDPGRGMDGKQPKLIQNDVAPVAEGHTSISIRKDAECAVAERGLVCMTFVEMIG